VRLHGVEQVHGREGAEVDVAAARRQTHDRV
jgi:hypothetical protein